MQSGDSKNRRRSAPIRVLEKDSGISGMTLRSGVDHNNSSFSSKQSDERGRRSEPYRRGAPAISPKRSPDVLPNLGFVSDRRQHYDDFSDSWRHNNFEDFDGDENGLDPAPRYSAPYPEEDTMPGPSNREEDYAEDFVEERRVRRTSFISVKRHEAVDYFEMLSNANNFPGYLVIFLVILMIIVLFFYCANSTRSLNEIEDYRIKLSGLSKEYDLDYKETAVIAEMIPIWARGGTMNPMVVVIYGSAGKLDPFYEKILKWTANVTHQRITAGFYCSETTTRAEFHKYFDNYLGGKRGPVFAAARHLQALRWDAPVALHAWADDGHRLADHAFILLGIDGPPVEGDCELSVAHSLSSQWIAQGGNADAIPPIVHSRMHYFICLK